jgi:tetratricopeptide (TPR) repeat protein
MSPELPEWPPEWREPENEARRLFYCAVLALLVDEVAEGTRLLEEALAKGERSLGPEHPQVAETLNILGKTYQRAGRVAEAEAQFRRVLALGERALGPDHQETIYAGFYLARLLRETGRPEEAAPVELRHQAAVQQMHDRVEQEVAHEFEEDDEPQPTSETQRLVFQAIDAMVDGKLGEATRLLEEALAEGERSLGPEHPHVAEALSHLASVAHFLKRPAEAEALYLRALAIYERAVGPESLAVARELSDLGAFYQTQGDPVRGEVHYRKALETWERLPAGEGPPPTGLRSGLGECLVQLGRPDEAAPLLREVWADRARLFADRYRTDELHASWWDAFYLSRGSRIRLEQRLESIRYDLSRAEREVGPEHPHVAFHLERLVRFLRRLDRLDDVPALEVRAQAIRARAASPSEDRER